MPPVRSTSSARRAPTTPPSTWCSTCAPDSAFTRHQPPQGYFHVGSDAVALAKAVLELRDAIGEFEKPKFFSYQQRLCAHSRNERIGCTACIDVCSAGAIRSDASLKGKPQGKARRGPEGAAGALKPTGGIVVEPHLCVGCGACSTVCPSGAISFAYPGAAEQGLRLRTLLRTYAAAGGRDAALLIHSDGAGVRRIDELGRAARTDRRLHGVPARVLPVAVWHTASVGLDLWLSAIAQGASQVWVLLTDEEAPEYRDALAAQMALAQAILSGLGYGAAPLQADRGSRCARAATRWTKLCARAPQSAWRGRPPLPHRPTNARRWSWRSTTCSRRRRAAGRKRSPCRPPAHRSAR